MRLWSFLIASSLILLSGCNGSTKLSETSLKNTLNEYLAAHGSACVAVDGKFPIDVPGSNWNDRSGQAAELAALERAGLVRFTNSTAVAGALAGSLSLNPRRSQMVKRYTVTDEGRRYLRQLQVTFGRSDGFCYGHEVVDSIVNWSKPETQGDYAETTVTYTFKVPDLADWAKRSEVVQAFPSVKTTLNDVGKNQTIALHQAGKGWIVNGS